MAQNSRSTYETEHDVFAKRLRQIMKEKGVNQTHLQRIIHDKSGKTLQRQTISLYMNGQSKPDTERLTMLCDALDVSADWLLGLDDSMTRQADIAGAIRITRLSEKAVLRIMESLWPEYITSLIETDSFMSILADFSDMNDDLNILKDAIFDINHFKEGDDIDSLLTTLNAMYTNIRLTKVDVKDSFSELIEDVVPSRESLDEAKHLLREYVVG